MDGAERPQSQMRIVDGGTGGADAAGQLRDLLGRATGAEREAALAARRHGEVSPGATDDVLFDIEARALRHDS